VITGQQLRAVLDAGGQVVDSAGQQVGHIVDVVLSAQSHQPAWLAVACGPGRVVVVPLAAAHRLDGCVQLSCTAADVRGAPGVDGAAGTLTSRLAEELAGYFDALAGNADHPPFAVNGRRRTTTPGSVFAVPGHAWLTGPDSPVAYPGADPGPWPALATSSPGPPWWQRRQWRWPSTASSIRGMRVELRPLLATTGLPADDLDDLVLAASEAAANAVEHARPTDRPYFDVLTEVGAEWAGILIQDHGRWRAASGGVDRGRGLYLMSVLADATLTVGKRGTTVVLRTRPAASG
jgi:anti-sigma regulatory factor (Ser/Thr protein kinase)